MVELGLHRGECRFVKAAAAQPIEIIGDQVDSRHAMLICRQPVRKPAAAGSQVQNVQRPLELGLHGPDDVLQESLKTGGADAPIAHPAPAQVTVRQGAVVLRLLRAASFGAPHGFIFPYESVINRLTFRQQHTPDLTGA